MPIKAILRDSLFGQSINAASRGRYFAHVEEVPGFIAPAQYTAQEKRKGTTITAQNSSALSPNATLSPDDDLSSYPSRLPPPVNANANAGKLGISQLGELHANNHVQHHTHSHDHSHTDVDAMERKVGQGDGEEQQLRAAVKGGDDAIDGTDDSEKTTKKEQQQQRISSPPSRADSEQTLEDGKDDNLVTWYGEDDPENPHNWSNGRKTLLMVSLQLLTFSAYIGSAIYTPSIPGVMAEFGVSQTKALLPLSMYVLGYGVGPMLLSPLSEIPSFGRLNVYMISWFIFVILQIPTALATNFNTLVAMRFFAGFVCSPALSTGGATLYDVFSPNTVPIVMALWAAGAVAGPVIGPVAGGYAAMLETWRWPLYILLFLSVFTLFFLGLFFPETSADTILLRRARRLRKLTGNEELRSESEIRQAQTSFSTTMKQAIIRPFVLLLQPSILAMDIFIALVYAIFYLWFEAFPIVFTEMYGFNLGLSGLPFVGFIVALVPTMAGYIWYQKYVVIPDYKRTGIVIPETRLLVALVGAAIIPFALFIFGWTSREDVHWMGPIVGASLYLPGIYLAFQGALTYLGMSYPMYAASVYAGNSLLRGITGAIFPLIGHPLFVNLGVGPACSLLAGLSIVMVPIIWLLYKFGAKLRARSTYAS